MSLSLEQVINKSFLFEDAKRIESFFDRLLPHLDLQKTAIVGGLAIRYHALSGGLNYPLREFNDLDIIATGYEAIAPAVQREMLVYHNHPDEGYLVLADPKTRIKVDIFPYDPAPDEVVAVDYKGSKINIISPEDQLIKTVLDTLKVQSSQAVDPKQFSDVEILMRVINREEANRRWQQRGYSQHPPLLEEAILLAKQTASEKPELLVEKPFRKLQPYKCPSCRNDRIFTLTPMKEVYKLLGYVE